MAAKKKPAAPSPAQRATSKKKPRAAAAAAAPEAPRPSRKAKPKKPRVGRPPKKPSDRRGERVVLRLTTSELAAIRVAADAAGMPLSTWIVHASFLAARKSP